MIGVPPGNGPVRHVREPLASNLGPDRLYLMIWGEAITNSDGGSGGAGAGAGVSSSQVLVHMRQ